MSLTAYQTELLLVDLERRVRGRGTWRGHAVFYQVLEYDLQPILDTAEDPDYVRAWIQQMLERNGHAPGPSVEAAVTIIDIGLLAHG